MNNATKERENKTPRELALDVLIYVTLCLCIALNSSAQTGGTYDLSHNVIASGGGSGSTGGTYRLAGTAGQGLAGTFSSAGGITVHGGFWGFGELAPTAAHVSVSGRILTANGNGIRGMTVTLQDASTGEQAVTLSSSFGHYRFDNVTVGQLYVLTVSSGRFQFAKPSRLIVVNDEIAEEDFTAMPHF